MELLNGMKILCVFPTHHTIHR